MTPKRHPHRGVGPPPIQPGERPLDIKQPSDIEDAAELIWNEAEQGRWFPEALQGNLDFDDGHRVQLALRARKLAAGQTQAGWKVGFTSERVRKKYGMDERPFGHLMTGDVYPSGAEVPIFPHAALEPELCLTLGSPLGGADVTPQQARRAVSAVAAAFELNQGRGQGVADVPLTVADNLSQWGIVVGASLEPVPENLELGDMTVVLRGDGQTAVSVLGREVIDDHFLSLAMLAKTLARHGLALEPGMKVITGSFAKVEVAPGQRWEAEFSGIGGVAVTFQ